MSNLTRVTSLNVAVEEAFDAAKSVAIEEYANARVEEVMLRAAETRLAVLEQRRQLVLRTFNVTDVVQLGGKLAKNRYAAEKLHEIFGGAFEMLKDQTGRPLCDIQIIRDDPDVGEVRIYTYYGRHTRTDGKITEQMGSFSTKHEFFAKSHGAWKTIHEIDVTDVMNAAQTETFKKTIFRSVGLGDWTEGEGVQLLSEAKGHDFKGSQTKAPVVEDILVPFGKSKGTKLTEASTADLEYVLKVTEESLNDPDKKRFVKANVKVRDAIKAIIAQRREPAPSQEGQAPSPVEDARQPAGATDPDTPTTRGALISHVFKKLEKATNRNQKHQAQLLRTISRERWTGAEIALLSDLSDEQLREVLDIPDDILTTVVSTLK